MPDNDDPPKSPSPGLLGSIPIVGQGLDALFQGIQNRKSRKWSEKMYGRQRADALADWNMQNEYNSPANQMARLKAAGLNPNLVYGNGADAQSQGTVRSSGVPGAQFDAPHFAPESALASIYDTKIKQAQYDNLKTQNTVNAQEAVLKAAQVLATLAGTGKTKAETAATEFDTFLKNQLKNITVEQASAQLEQTRANTQFTLSENERKQALQSYSLQEAAVRILEGRSRLATSSIERQKILAEIEGIRKDNTIKDFEIQLNKSGMTKHDSMWFRMLNEILTKDDKRTPEIKRKEVEHFKREYNSRQYQKN